MYPEMVYPFLTLDDGTVKVHMETADKVPGFKRATCRLPYYKWEDSCGYPEDDIKKFEEVIRPTAHLIIVNFLKIIPQRLMIFKISSKDLSLLSIA